MTPDVGSQSDSGISPVCLQRYSGTFDILPSGVCSAAPDTVGEFRGLCGGELEGGETGDPSLGEPDVPTSPQAEELQGFGQCPLDPGACRVALTPFLRFLLAADLLPR